MAGYYKRIKGKNYDRELIDMADASVSGKGDGRISLADAKRLLSGVQDADSYTDIEKRTMKYIRDKYKFTKEADKWFRTEIRKWAGKRGAQKPKAKTETKARKSKSKKKTTAAAAASPPPVESALPEPSPVLLSEEPGEDNEERTAFWKILWVVPLLLLVFFAYYAVKCEGQKKDTTNITVSQDKEPAEKDVAEVKKVEPESIEENKVKTVTADEVTGTKIQFKRGKTVLRTDEKNKLQKVITYLKENPGSMLTITGHTCNIGGEIINQPLSLKRAQIVSDYLVEKGAPSKQVTVKGAGQSKPIASNKTARGRIENRRVEFSLQ